ncbi:MAG TPA: tetratricopeptide repeat protein [bacterium]|nr:tetratricopeptide repeat protein [bacterium]
MNLFLFSLIAILILIILIFLYNLIKKTMRNNSQKAIALFNKGKYSEALEIFQLLYSNTHNNDYLYKIGECQERLKNYSTAIMTFRNVLNNIDKSSNVTEDMVYNRLFYCYVNLNDIINANKIIEHFEFNIENKKIFLQFAELKIKNNQLQDAQQLLKKIITVDSSDIFALTLLAETYQKLSDIKNAINIYEKIIRLQPNNSEIYYKLGNSYNILQNSLKAIETYTRALEISTGNLKFDILSALVRTFFKSSEYEAAIEYLILGLNEFSGDLEKKIELQYFLALSYYYTDRKDEAYKLFLEISKHKPHYENISVLLNQLVPKKTIPQIITYLNDMDKSVYAKFLENFGKYYNYKILKSEFLPKSELLIEASDKTNFEKILISIKLWEKPANDIVLLDFNDALTLKKFNKGLIFLANGLNQQTYHLLQNDEFKKIAIIEKKQFADILNQILRMA